MGAVANESREHGVGKCSSVGSHHPGAGREAESQWTSCHEREIRVGETSGGRVL